MKPMMKLHVRSHLSLASEAGTTPGIRANSDNRFL